MARRALRLLAVSGILAVLASCSLVEPHLSVLEGNYAYGQGEFQSATVHYLEALSREEYAGWIRYNLGNVYHALGETGSAFDVWEGADESGNKQLLFQLSFNRGVAYYELGEYRKAYQEFMYALTLNSASVAAKRNLELSLRKIRASQAVRSAGEPQDVQPEQGPEAEALRILDYVRRKEEQRWFATEGQGEAEAARDW